MASKFIIPMRDQAFFEHVSYHEQLGVDHLVWTLIDVVEGLDLSAIYERYAPDVGQGGRPALDPAMMVVLLVFGYCEGKRSSRRLEDACRRDWAYRAICGGHKPDHATIARFRVLMDDVLEDLFAQVLMACADAGMIDVGVIALDGTKMASVASKDTNRTAPTLARMGEEARRMLDEAALVDNKDNNAPHTSGASGASGGDGGVESDNDSTRSSDTGDGDDDTTSTSTSDGSSSSDVGESSDTGDDGVERSSVSSGIGDGEDSDDDTSTGSSDTGDGSGSSESSGITSGGGLGRVSSLSRRETDRVRRSERIVVAGRVVARAVTRRGAEVAKRSKPKNPVANVTDPESRLQKTRNGFIQGYNAQAVVSGDQVVIACNVTSEGTDSAQLLPMLQAAKTNVTNAGVRDPVGVALADAGYASEANFGTGAVLGMSLLIATTRTSKVGKHDVSDTDVERDRRRLDMCARIHTGEYTITDAAKILDLSYGWTSELYRRYRNHGSLSSTSMLAWAAMAEKLREPENRDLYKDRGWMVEGSFAHTKQHRDSAGFTRHGLEACRAEWNLINIAGNLAKLHKKRLATQETRPPSPPQGRPTHPTHPISGRQTPPWRSVTAKHRSTPKIRHHRPRICHQLA